MSIRDVYIPYVASVFSAYGAATSDLVVRSDAEARRLDLHRDTGQIDAMLRQLETQARATLAESGGRRATVELRAGMRFMRQVHEYVVTVGALPFDAAAAEAVEARFRQEYETVVGTGSASTDARVELVSVSIEARLALGGTEPGAEGAPTSWAAGRPGTGPTAGSPGASSPPTTERRAWFDGELRTCPVHQVDVLPGGATIDGPAFVDLPTTTVVVYPELRLVVEPGYLRLTAR